jgi:NADH:ubiquinone oxidoreductase subunit 5 (subunit L)/multisubunit Na+/H+ antiporter MnhA subunit
MAPLAAFVLAATSVRTRRSAANMAMLGAVVALVTSMLTVWGLTKRSTPFVDTHPYLNISVAFSGPVNFQGFGIDIILRVDHLTAVAMVVVELCVIGAIGWHRVMGRAEPGPARFYALVSVFLFGSLGALVSRDLAELFAFWGLVGATTYLLLAHRWSSDEAARTSRIALALPFLTDLCLLCGIAVLYSRYGVQDLNGLQPILHTTLGTGPKGLVVASVLLFAGVAGRLTLWPLHSWITRTSVTSPPAASAMVQAVWSVVAIVVLYRLMPVIAASSAQTLRGLLYASAAAAVAGPLLALLGNEPRRVIALAGSGIAAVGAAVVIRGFQGPGFTFAVAGIACVLAAAPARAAAVMAASALSAAMRTDDMAEMGDGWRRMRASSGALLVAAVVLAVSASGALAYAIESRSRLGFVLGEAVLLVSIAVLRVFASVATGPLRRRRAFEPDRVREAAPGALGWPYWLAFGGAVLAVASLVSGWMGFLDGQRHVAPAPRAFGLWAVVSAIGFAAVWIAFSISKDGALRASSAFGEWLGRAVGSVTETLGRRIDAPTAAARVGEWIQAGDSTLGRAATTSGRLAFLLARAPASAPALLILVAALLALAVALLTPGLYR